MDKFTATEQYDHELIILAGPSGSGKSTFANELRNNNVHWLQNNTPNRCVELIKPRDLEHFKNKNRQIKADTTYILHIAINSLKEGKESDPLIDFFLAQIKPKQLVILTFTPDKHSLARMYFLRMLASCKVRMLASCKVKSNKIIYPLCFAMKIIDIAKVSQIFRYCFTNVLYVIYGRWDQYLCCLRNEHYGKITVKAFYIYPIYNKRSRINTFTYSETRTTHN